MPNLYNIIAALCSDIVNSCSEEFFVKYSCVSPAERDRIYREVRAGVGTLFLDRPEGGTVVRELVPSDLTETFFAEIKSLFINIEQAELESHSQSQFGRLVSFHLVVW